MKHVKKLLALVVTIAMMISMLASTGLTASAIEGAGYGGTKYMIHGIDLSYWNVGGNTLNYSLVNFDKLVASGCEFAILRIGLGSSSNNPSMDKAFLEFYKRGRAAGMKLGCYFYSHALTYNEAANEAKWCINIIEQNNMYFEYPIYVDMEESDQTALGSTAFTNIALGFCNTVTDAGYFSGFYGMHSSQSKLTSSYTSNYDRWTAKVKSATNGGSQFSYNTYDYSGSYGMWQYSWYGQARYQGIGLDMLDVNICYKDYPAIMAKYGYNNVAGGGSVAHKLGTYRINSNAPTTDPLNVRTGAGTSYDIVDTVVEGNIVNVTELSGNWGKFITPNGKEGWASVKNNADYIGLDVLSSTGAPAFGEITTSVDADGRLTLTNTTAEQVAYDFRLPFQIGTTTTPYFAIMVTPKAGNGYYFGLSQQGSGYFMMRDCNSGDQLVNETSAPYMTGTEVLEINVKDWWPSDSGYRIDMVRMYLGPNASVVLDYMYFAASAGTVKDTTYNLVKGSGSSGTTPTEVFNANLMSSSGLAIVDTAKTGSYTYDHGKLTVVSEATDSYSVTFNVNKTFDINTYKTWLYSIEANVRYDVAMVVTTTEGDRVIGLAADYWPNLCDATDGIYLPAATRSAALDLLSAYTWNNVLPADGKSTIKTVTVTAGGKGTVTLSALQVASNDALAWYSDDVVVSDSSPVSQPDTDPDVDPDRPVIVMGDVDGDGEVSTTDARTVLLYTVDLADLTADQLAVADYNGDGIVSTMDAREMLMSLVA